MSHEAHCVIRKFVRSNPAQGSKCVQVFAVLPTQVVGLGDLIGPVGAVTLGRAVREPANVVGTIFERRVQAS
jgi:hypothetical protein